MIRQDVQKTKRISIRSIEQFSTLLRQISMYLVLGKIVYIC